MAVRRVDALAVAAAGILAIGGPAWLLMPGREAPVVVPAPVVLAPVAPPPLSAIFARDLFGGKAAEDAPVPADAPELAGIVGRIGRDAVALVRAADGRTRTLAVGSGVDGWTLESLAIDAAFFARGGQRVRVPLPAGDGVE